MNLVRNATLKKVKIWEDPLIVFADLHHGSLYHSLQIVFECRLRSKIFRPIGMDWYHEGFWKIADPYDNPEATAYQYLGMDHDEWDRFAKLNPDLRKTDDFYVTYDPDHEIHQRALTLEQFKKVKPDVVIASYIDHIEPYHRLIKEHSPNSKLVHQMGNNWIDSIDFDIVKNLMASTSKKEVPDDVNAVFYHQEFDTRRLFNYDEYYREGVVRSFVNNLSGEDLKTFLALEKELAGELEFYMHGAEGRDGNVETQRKLSRKMKMSQFTFHLKEGGDGYGHIIHNTFAVGIPPIVKMRQYEGQLAYDMMVDGESCIDIGGLSIERAADKIRGVVKNVSHYRGMRKHAHKAFWNNVNWRDDAVRLAKFLLKLK